MNHRTLILLDAPPGPAVPGRNTFPEPSVALSDTHPYSIPPNLSWHTEDFPGAFTAC